MFNRILNFMSNISINFKKYEIDKEYIRNEIKIQYV